MFEKLRSISLKIKLVLFIGAIVLISIATVSSVSYNKSKHALNELTQNQLSSSGMSIKGSLNWFLARTKNFTSILSRDRLVEGLLIAYESSFFGSNFDPGKDLKIDNDFYKKLDKIYGERKAKILDEYELKDLLLVSLDAQIIFTAKNSQKELFLGRNLKNGVFKDSALHKCYEDAMASKTGELVFSGFDYSDVTKSVDGYICGKKNAEFANQDEGIDKGDNIGIIITQINNDIITEMLTSRTGMGKTGQSYLVGNDLLLRSDFFVNSKKFNALNSMKNGVKIDTGFVKKALKGKTGNEFDVNVNGDEVLAYYQPFPFMGKDFAIITEKTSDEIFESITDTLVFITTIATVMFIIIIFLTILVTNSFLGPVISAKDILDDVSGKLKSNAENLQSFSNSLREGAEDTSSSIHETVSTMNELSQMVNQNLANVKQTNATSEEVVGSVTKGKSETNEMMNSVNDISNNNNKMIDTINDINTKMVEFKDVINNIAEKTKIINEIVSQTKLLSFNASVEAARAGELGKGFAVVAEEVGNLASASGVAAEDISKLISESVEGVEKMISETNSRIDIVKRETQQKIDNGKDKAKSCENSLSVINNQIEQMTSKISEISVASNEQANGIQEISKAMTNLSETSQQTSKVANDTLSYSNEILEKSDDLIKISKDLGALVTGKR